jgi:hypothetical protein
MQCFCKLQSACCITSALCILYVRYQYNNWLFFCFMFQPCQLCVQHHSKVSTRQQKFVRAYHWSRCCTQSSSSSSGVETQCTPASPIPASPDPHHIVEKEMATLSDNIRKVRITGFYFISWLDFLSQYLDVTIFVTIFMICAFITYSYLKLNASSANW